MDALLKVSDALKNIRETRLNALRSPMEFFDYQRISRPADFTQATSRITYNTRYFSGNYGLIMVGLAIWAFIANINLLYTLIFLVGGFILINKFAPEATQVGEHTITQKHLYTALFVIGIPLTFWFSPFYTIFWILGASLVVILGHAMFMEPGIESEYATVSEAV